MKSEGILEGLFYTSLYGLVLTLVLSISKLTYELKILSYLTLLPMFIVFYYLPLLPNFIPKNNIVDRSIQRLGIWLYINIHIPILKGIELYINIYISILRKIEERLIKNRKGAERKLELKKDEYAELVNS